MSGPKLVKKTGERVSSVHEPAPIPKMPPPPPPKIDFTSGGSEADVFFQASGLETLAEILQTMPQYIRRAAGVEMSNILWEVIDDAKANYVPRDTMALHDSGMADEYSDTFDQDILQLACWFGAPGMFSEHSGEYVGSTGLEGELSARKVGKTKGGGGARQSAGSGGQTVKRPEDYALEQHENLEYKHPFGGPKYLEKPFNKRMDTFAPRIAAAISQSLGFDVMGADIDVSTGPDVQDANVGGA